MEIITKYDIGRKVRYMKDGEAREGVITSAFIHVIKESFMVAYGIRAGSGQDTCAESGIIETL